MTRLADDLDRIVDNLSDSFIEDLKDSIRTSIKQHDLTYTTDIKDPFIAVMNINNPAVAVRFFTHDCKIYAEFKFAKGISITVDISTYGYGCIRDHTNWNTYFYDEITQGISIIELFGDDSIVVNIHDEDGGIHPEFTITGASVPGSGSNEYKIRFTDHEQKKKEIFFDRIFKDEFKDKKIYFRDYRKKPDWDQIPY